MKAKIVTALERLLGLRIDLNSFYEFSQVDARLALLAQRFRGLKPPRFPGVFEALVNGIACQQLSLAVGVILLGRLSEAYGAPFDTGMETQHSFPISEHLAAANASDLRQMGFSSNKTRALIELASAGASGQLDVEGLDSAEDAEAIVYLLNIRGIGRWTAEYALLRGMGRTNIFPGDDVGARNNLARWLKMHGELDYDRVARRLSKWKLYGGLIYFHLLMDALERAGFVQAGFPHPDPVR
jgi:DNA-3-methyladenine glycosylase II